MLADVDKGRHGTDWWCGRPDRWSGSLVWPGLGRALVTSATAQHPSSSVHQISWSLELLVRDWEVATPGPTATGAGNALSFTSDRPVFAS
jgi:hypothetical protein